MFRPIFKLLPVCVVVWLARRHLSRRDFSGEMMVQPFDGVLISAGRRPYRPSLRTLLRWWWKPDSDNGIDVLVEVLPALTERDLRHAIHHIDSIQRANGGVIRRPRVRVKHVNHYGAGTITGTIEMDEKYEVTWDSNAAIPTCYPPEELILLRPDFIGRIG